MNKGQLFIVSGPSGSGKGTLLEYVLGKYAPLNIFYSVSATTRSIREGEKDGVNYHYITVAAFKELIANDGLLEYNILSTGDMYGTPKAPLRAAMNEGRPCILEIEPNGMRKIRESYPQAVTVFIAPPSLEILEKRIRGRGTETEQQIAKRMKTAETEMKAIGEYDYTVINDELEDATREILKIFALYLD